MIKKFENFNKDVDPYNEENWKDEDIHTQSWPADQGDFNHDEHIEGTNDIEFLKQLLIYINDDIENLKNTSPTIIKMKAMMHDKDPVTFLRDSMYSLNQRKKLIEKRIEELRAP